MKKYILIFLLFCLLVVLYLSCREGRVMYHSMSDGNVYTISGKEDVFAVSGRSTFKMDLAKYVSSIVSLEVFSSGKNQNNASLFRNVFVKSKIPYLMGYVPAWRKINVISGSAVFGLQTGFDLENIGTTPSKNNIFLSCALMNYLFFNVYHSDGSVFFVLDGFSGTLKFTTNSIQKGNVQDSIVSFLGQSCP